MTSRIPLVVVTIAAILSCIACGGGSIAGTKQGATTFTVGGTVSGLATGTSVTLSDGAGSSVTVNANGSFVFPAALNASASYNVTVSTQPSGENCSVSNATGVANANITNVSVTCSPDTFTIGGTLSGLASGATIVLSDNGTDNLSLTADGSFTFAQPVASGSPYAVTVKTPPAGQTCTVSNGSGTATANVTNVSVTCSTTSVLFTLSASVSGLTSGTLVLQDDAGQQLTFTGNTTQTFSNTYASGATYSVTIATQPSGFTCSLSSNSTGTITANTTVAVTCTANAALTVSASVSGLTSGTLVLQDDAGKQLTFTSSTTQTFSNTYASGATYAVTIATQPVGFTCTLGSNSTGTITANVTVAVTCTANPTFTLSATVSGLTSGTLVLQDDAAKQLTFTGSGTQTFSNTYVSGATYAVTIATQPAGFTCALGSNSTGTITANTTVTVTCTATAGLTLSASVTGLTSGTLVLQDDAAQQLTFTSSTTQTFSNTYTSGSTYSVGVLTQPAGFTCTVGSNSTGTITANTTVAVTCTATATLTLSVTVSGLTSGTLVLQDDAAQQLTFTGSGTQTFSNTYASGAAYSVTIVTQPSGFTCTLGSNSSGTITANVTVTATCVSTSPLTLSVTTTGLTGGTLIVQDDASQTLSFTSATTKTFSNTYLSGATYSVTITQQPTGFTCSLSSNSSGTITANTTVTASCTSSTASGEWAWVNGNNVVAVGGLYPTNNPVEPGTRYGAYTWTDASGKFWLFGGFGYDINGPKITDTTPKGAESALSDLWNFDGTKWTFKGGPSQNGQCFAFPSSTGQAGTPSGRSNGVSWIDLQGNAWIFGGYESYMVDITQCPNALIADAFNDWWEYTPSTNTWTWRGGSPSAKQSGTYNSINQTGTPGARFWSTGARDANGIFWMFGGYGFDKSSNEYGYLNDLWKFDGTNWTWVSGSSKENQKGVYSGTMVPGSRYGASSWIDSSGNFWIFGGNAYDSTGAVGDMNDLWEFNVSTSTWTFVGGSSTVANAAAVYGTQGVADPANTPGGRVWSTTWVTPNGDVWLLGGVYSPRDDFFNDLWKYSGGEWTWVGPDATPPVDQNSFINMLGVYPAQTGLGPQPGIEPGSRAQGASWSDANGNLWLFGGVGLGSLPVSSTQNVHSGFDSLNDLWEFQP
jgi:hypothetical protein